MNDIATFKNELFFSPDFVIKKFSNLSKMQNEYLVYLLGADIIPKMISVDWDNNKLVLQRIPSILIKEDFFAENLDLLARSLSIFHSLKPDMPTLRLDEYVITIKKKYQQLYLENKIPKSIAFDLWNELTRCNEYYDTVLIHNDIKAMNILYCHNKIYFIDFEYTIYGPIILDLARVYTRICKCNDTMFSNFLTLMDLPIKMSHIKVLSVLTSIPAIYYYHYLCPVEAKHKYISIFRESLINFVELSKDLENMPKNVNNCS